jgi:GT2 family glycosyltransferase
MTADARVAAIIVTHNRAERLRRSLRSVLRQQPEAPSLIVVDNGCTDHTTQVLQEECPDATVIRLPRNTGCVVGSNIGAAAATQDVLFFLDDDSELAVDAVASATRVLLSDERIGAVVSTIVENGAPIRITRTASPTFINVCHQGAFRRRAFIAAGMYPADFFYGAEEMDLSLRLLEAGYDIVFDPRTVLFHASEPQSRRPFGELEVHRNMLRVVLMRAPFVLLVPWALKKLCDTLTAALRTGRPGVVAGELIALPRTILLSLWHRKAISWKVFAAWRYLATREVTCRNYRDAALLEYPGRLRLLFGYLQNPSTAGGVDRLE